MMTLDNISCNDFYVKIKCTYIIWLSNLSILSVPDDGYSRNMCAH